MSLNNLKLISAGAGSGKTYRLTEELSALLTAGKIKPSGIIATTFTKRAAAELRERVRVKLLRQGLSADANELKNALIGTVHGLGVKLLKRFAFEAGVSPRVDIIADQDHQRLFNLSMASALDVDDIEKMEALCDRLSLSKDGQLYDWRKDVLRLVEVLRANNFSAEDIQRSKGKSWASLAAFLPEVNKSISPEQFENRLKIALNETIAALENNEADGTKKTQGGINILKRMRYALRRGTTLPWEEIANLGVFAEKKVGAKSRDLCELVVEIGALHSSLPAFQEDIKAYISYIFDFAAAAIKEYQAYKSARGRIDYTDMETLVLELLGNSHVQATLREELDLLIVDEFQDTSPIQLAIFLKLSQLAKQSIWVGDPKQSIYGFRGAEPRLMKAVMDATGPIKPENIQKNSWRSRADIVYACNSLFTKGFPEIAEEAVVLEPVRTRAGGLFNKPPESEELAERSAIIHWQFNLEGKGRVAKSWYLEMTAIAVGEMLANPPLIVPKDGGPERRLRPSDIAAICRSNQVCTDFAKALSNQGIATAIARTGLLQTAEATLLLACLKYMLNPGDSLCTAEILLFGSRLSLAEIINHRFDYLEEIRQNPEDRKRWAADNQLLSQLKDLRDSTAEYSTNELLNILLEQLDIRRIVVTWGDAEQRLGNLDELRRLTVDYEENCHRQHRAASLPGYLLYLDQLLRDGTDKQGAGERPEAVNVLTYHKSKGLEWPAVIALDLDQKLRAEVWGINVVPEQEEVDLNAPLANRWIKYWVKPYSNLKSGLPWLDALNESHWQEEATDTARAEEARLLYVGLTRARDYLIFPLAKPGAPWLDRVYERGGGITPVISPDTEDTPFDWRGHEVSKLTKTWTEPRNLPGREMEYHAVPFLEKVAVGDAIHQPATIDSEWLLKHFPAVSCLDPEVYFTRPELDPEISERMLSQLLGAFIAGNTPALPQVLQEERAEILISNYLPTNDLDSSILLGQSDGFHQWLKAKMGGGIFKELMDGVQKKVKLHTNLGDRKASFVADWVVATSEGTLLIRDVHQTLKVFQGQADQRLLLEQEAAALSLCWQQIYGEKPAGVYLHLPVAGSLYEVKPAE